MKALLSLDGVGKRYARGYRELDALDGISLDVDRGDFVAIWGSSRSGKTTLLRVAAGIEESELKFKRHVVSVDPVIEKLQI